MKKKKFVHKSLLTTFLIALTFLVNLNKSEAQSEFWLEPSSSSTIGVGQNFDLYSVMKKNATDLFPKYIDPALVTFKVANSKIATVTNSGLVFGLSQGSTTISAQYLGQTQNLKLVVNGKMISRKIVSGGIERTFFVYEPNFSVKGSKPLLFALHGGGGNAMQMASSSLLNKLAQEKGFYVAYPDGTGTIQTWNGGSCCGSAQTQNIDDVQFIKMALSDIKLNFNVDSNKIFSTGFSNGSIMSHRLACTMADQLAGIVTVGGGSGQYDFELNQFYICNPARPVKVLQFHTTNDRNYPINGGHGGGISSVNYYSIDATNADWLKRNNLTTKASIVDVTPTTRCAMYSTKLNPRKPSAPVTLCKLNPKDVYDAENEVVYGGGHSWPGGVRSPSPKSDIPQMDFNLNAYMWENLNK